ncbi:MAG: hypothetical protein JSV52_07630 [Candidatus Zixiibacteriota bacterium]|nr:MAG: hypothetical protein JSV52_07630 [candidate division Zixibacteria bacterium]
MDYRGSDTDALQMLIDHENTISELYTAYADRFADRRQYWLNLAHEETEHADELRKLLPLADKGNRVLNTSGFKPAAVNTSVSYLRDQIRQARGGLVTLRDALSTALDLEKAMIERKFFDILDTPAPEAQSVLITLTDGTQKHIETIETEWQKLRTVQA